jgi:hypothetical protein
MQQGLGSEETSAVLTLQVVCRFTVGQSVATPICAFPTGDSSLLPYFNFYKRRKEALRSNHCQTYHVFSHTKKTLKPEFDQATRYNYPGLGNAERR